MVSNSSLIVHKGSTKLKLEESVSGVDVCCSQELNDLQSFLIQVVGQCRWSGICKFTLFTGVTRIHSSSQRTVS